MNEYIKSNSCMIESDTKKLLYALIKPLNYLHMGGAGFKVVHKNVKLSQVLIENMEKGIYKLSDVGLPDGLLVQPGYVAPEVL